MRTTAAVSLLVALTAGCVTSNEPTAPVRVLSEEELAIAEEYRQWLRDSAADEHEQKRQEQKTENQLEVEIAPSTRTPLKDLAATVMFNRITVTELGAGGGKKVYRVTGEFLPNAENGIKSRFFDSGFYTPACGGPYDVELTRASSFALMKVPVFAVDEQLTSELCDKAPSEKITRTHFYVVREKIDEILLLETGFVKSDSKHRPKGSRLLDTIYYPDGCAGDGNCKHLTVWAFDTAKSAVNVTKHTWDESNLRLVPFKK